MRQVRFIAIATPMPMSTKLLTMVIACAKPDEKPCSIRIAVAALNAASKAIRPEAIQNSARDAEELPPS